MAKPNRDKAIADAENVKVPEPAQIWTFLEDEAEKSGLLARNPAIGAAIPLAALYIVIRQN